MLSVSLILCLTRDVLPKSMSFITNILAHSVMSSHALFHSDFNLLTLLHQFCPTILFDYHISFSQWWLHPYLTPPCWLWYQQSKNDVCCCDLSHSSPLWKGYLLCIMIYEVNINLPLPGFNTP